MLKNKTKAPRSQLISQFLMQRSVAFLKHRRILRATTAGTDSLISLFGNGKFSQSRWLEESSEYLACIHALMDLFASARLPISLIDQPDFRNFCSLLDPKFQLPRQYFYFL